MFDQLIKSAPAAAAIEKAPKAKPLPRTTRAATSKAVAPTVAAPKGIKFAIVDFARPREGAALFAHTAAFFEVAGLTEGAAVPKAFAQKVMGATAVAYHTKNGNFTQTEKGLTLTEKGILFFGARSLDAEKVHAYIEFFEKGALNETINVKAQTSVIKL